MVAGKLFEKWHSFASRRLVVSTLSKVVLYLCTCTSIQITSNMNPATNGTFNYNNLYTILLLWRNCPPRRPSRQHFSIYVIYFNLTYGMVGVQVGTLFSTFCWCMYLQFCTSRWQCSHWRADQSETSPAVEGLVPGA